ncbi:eukaryotic translation initiation factor 3 subunit 8 N-terminus-domain-containing protein [Mycena olivaceomarginata]|nr:eukaryotic translation initiation factor 3 subunit 8 N-terminus-domain-containing protein [Mycena olivaceomarginata]
MSRFFRQADDSDSSESSDSEDELMSSPRPPAKTGMDQFLAGGSSDSDSSDSESSDDDGPDSDDDEPQQAVRIMSAQEKRLVEMEATGKVMENALKINDWVAISNEFDKLVRMIQRQHNVSEPIPPFYVKTLVSLENSVNNALAKEKEAKQEKDSKKTSKVLNATNAKALTAMKQKLKKSVKEYETDVNKYNTDPEAFEKEYSDLVAQSAPVAPTDKAGPRPVHTDDKGEDDDGFKSVGKGGKTMQFSSEVILKNLQAVQEARGKKNTDRAEQIRILEKLLEVAVTAYQRIRVLLALVSSRFDYNSSVATHMPIELWLSAQREVDQLVAITPEEKGGIVRIRGSIISFVDRLDDEFTKSLQNIDPHGTEYIDRLKDEKVLYCTISRAQAFYENTNQDEPLGRVIMRRLEHIYSKPDAVVQALEAAVEVSDIKPNMRLASQGTTHIYHHALHNDFHTARDMLLMSHLQESIHSADVATQILYNRTVDIFTTQRVKELLAQGVHQQRFQVLSPEQEKAEKQRQLPFHMHINTELLEAAFLVSSMLIEIPLLASIDSDELKRKAISKPFRRLLDFADRQVFTGPPESTRDHIMQASKALQDGEWEQSAAVKEMLAKRIQEQGLRTYLFTYAPHYSTLSLSLLSRTFSLPLRTVTSIVSKMIWSEELSASLDQSGGVVVFHRIELSRAQQLAQTIADKVGAMVEQNEKALDVKMGGTGGWGDRADGNKGEKRGEQTQERRGRGDRTRGTRGTFPAIFLSRFLTS